MPATHSHLTIRPEGDGADVRTLFADQPVGRARIFSGTAVHIVVVLVLLAIARLIPEKTYETILPDRLPADIVWLVQPGPGGGGGGGNRNPEPPKPAEAKGADPVTVPATPPPEPTPVPVPEPPVFEPQLLLPAEMLAAADASALGVIAPPTTSDSSRGSGTGGGAGPGQGSGLGPGSGGGIGGDVYQPGNGVTSPIAIREVKPTYTSDAVLARAQGVVDLDCVVLPDGRVGSCDVVRAMKPPFGLDARAIEAARQWQFRPGTRMGEPVPVLVRIELTFSLR